MGKANKDIPFLITISYFISFLFIRMFVYIAGAAKSEFAQTAELGLTPDVKFHLGRNIILFGYHIHHFYIGIVLICIAGWLSIVDSSLLTKKQIAVIYGAGLGLFMDEIGLLLTWGDYFSGLSYLLSLFLAGIFLNIIFFPHFWKEVRKNLAQKGPKHVFIGSLFIRQNLLRLGDFISQKTLKTEKASLIFAGTISLFIGGFILIYPQFLQYGLFCLFFIQGITHLVRIWER